jgi:hypothetical protein
MPGQSMSWPAALLQNGRLSTTNRAGLCYQAGGGVLQRGRRNEPWHVVSEADVLPGDPLKRPVSYQTGDLIAYPT